MKTKKMGHSWSSYELNLKEREMIRKRLLGSSKTLRMMQEEELMQLKEDAWNCKRIIQLCTHSLLKWSPEKPRLLNLMTKSESSKSKTKISHPTWALLNLKRWKCKIWRLKLNEEMNLSDVKSIFWGRTRVSFKEKTLLTRRESEFCRTSWTEPNWVF
jgi:hypothetical protein